MRAALWLSVAFFVPSIADAQGTRIVGRAFDRSSQQPIAGARITVRGLSTSLHGQLVSAADGRVALDVLAGNFEVTTSHPGFATRIDTIEVRAGIENSIALALDAAPVPVDTLVAKATSSRPHLGGFWERRERKLGYYFTREDIERRKPMRLTDLFRTMPGAKVMPGPNGLGQFVTFGRVRGLNGQLCQAAVYLDGRPHKMTPVGLDDFFPDMVEAIEAYPGSSRLPSQFNATGTPGANPQCGVIVIWTRTAQGGS